MNCWTLHGKQRNQDSIKVYLHIFGVTFKILKQNNTSL